MVFAVLGVGKFTLWLLGLRTLTWYWRLAFVAVLGQVTLNLMVQALLLSGRSSTPRLRILGWIVVVLGLLGHLLAGRRTVARQRAYALGAPEAGNVLSLGYSIILGFFLMGFLRHATGNDSLALLGGLGCVVGVYQTVLHTTEGAAAIGDLALAVAVCGILWPRSLLSTLKPLQYGLLIVTAASLAASTKISL